VKAAALGALRGVRAVHSRARRPGAAHRRDHNRRGRGELPVLEGAADTLARAPGAPVFCQTRPGSDADVWLRARRYRASPSTRQGSFGNYRYDR